jgi:FAD dependent oxidoreductase TIGR03364
MQRDVVIVGSGIVGMACAWAAKQRGRDVIVLEKDDHCVGASIRNFGFVTVTGQGRGDTWRRAKATRDVWCDVVESAGIAVLQRGLLVLAQRDEAVAVLHALCEQAEGQDLRWLDRRALVKQHPVFDLPGIQGALYSPHELRIESRNAVPQLRRWLQAQGVEFQSGVVANLANDGALRANGVPVNYRDLAIAPGADLRSFAPQMIGQAGIRTCRLSMMRVRPPDGYVLPAPVMSDLSLIRYRGYAELPESKLLHDRLLREQPDHIAHGVHLIVVQSADGSLVVGDSHHYGTTIDPFAHSRSEALILDEMQAVLQLPHFEVVERWVGYYPSGPVDAIVHPLAKHASLVSVTSGTGMSTSFALAQEWAKERL